MSVVIYKDGKQELCNPIDLQNLLDSGYSLTEKTPTQKADTNNSGKLSTDEVRAAAKEAGIENWETGKIKTLKSKLKLG
jgi:hypothetical protein